MAKAKKNNPEQLKEIKLNNDLKGLMQKKDLYLNPNKFFEVGEEVEHVNAFYSKCFIKENIENLFYLVEIRSINHNYGKDIPTVNCRYLPWTELRAKKQELAEISFNQRKNNIMNSFSFGNRDISDLLSKHYSFRVNNSPDYQRDLVWGLEDKQLLIESIFKGIDIGKFVFISLDYKDESSPMYEILDGKQRLNAIIEFTQDRFEFNRYKFSNLSLEDRRYFERYLITIGESRGELTEKQKYEYFLSLNTRGREQSKEHIEKVRKLLEKVK